MLSFEEIKTLKPWALTNEEIIAGLETDINNGITDEEALKREKIFGRNTLKQIKPKNAWEIFVDQLKSLMVIFLSFASVLSFFFDDYTEGFSILAVILINTIIGFFTEYKAVRSMEALKKLGDVCAKTLRDGIIKEIKAQNLVPGDVIILEAGDIINADLRITESSKLQVDEAALTGESEPVEKTIEKLDEKTPLTDRSNMLFKGTSITRGSGKAIVVKTGMDTEIGLISSLVEKAEHEQKTPLEKRLDRLANRLIWVAVAIVPIIAISGIITGKNLLLMIETGVALAVATLPEGLPIVATIALARGMLRMARHNALINRLSAVETLGATSVICTDKTGTLTENKMTVVRIISQEDDIDFEENPVKATYNKVIYEIFRTILLCNNASLKPGENGEKTISTGDPMEIALLAAGIKAELWRQDIIVNHPELREDAFDSETKKMATFNRDGKRILISVKGAPEKLLTNCSYILTENGAVAFSEKGKAKWMNTYEKLGESGLRVIAAAQKTVDSIDINPYENLIFLGLIGLLDPPRAGVKDTIEQCRQAGIKVVMVTGDHRVTAKNIAKAVGLITSEDEPAIEGADIKPPSEISEEERKILLSATIFARVDPKQKLDLIDLHQKNGAVVAMTGDGVNDAPALKKADIGVAMGLRGTQIAKDAADIVLRDDAFSTIVFAVKQGRIIFNNIRKFVFYLISCNISEIAIIFLASVIRMPLPILPLQILFLNLVTDVFPALALGMGEESLSVMKYPPRKQEEQILSKKHWYAMFGYGALITISVLIAFILALEVYKMPLKQATTISFFSLALAQLWHVFNMRDRGSEFIKNDITTNKYVWGAIILCILLIAAAMYIPILALVLNIADPGLTGWAIIIATSLIPWIIGQILKSAGIGTI